MTQENKELLLKDLCARLPYKVKVDAFPYTDPQLLCMVDPIRLEYRLDFSDNKSVFKRNWVGEEVSEIKPYLRPMSSMTDDERDEFRIVGGVMSHNIQNDTWAICAFAPEAYDWLNEHHFDYRGLIEKGLALESQEEMYKIE